MHSFRPSRGRVFFDFSCTLVIVASCVGAWVQTGASALLAAAAAAGLHGLVHLLDMRWPKSAKAIEPQRIEFAADPHGDAVARLDADLPPVVAEQQLASEQTVDFEQSKPGRKTKAPRKAGGRKVSAAKDAEVIDIGPRKEADIAEIAEIAVTHEVTHSHIEPLFEAEPFARMPRRAFGRRGQI